MIAYASRKLKPHKENYLTRDLELGVVVFSLKILRHYLHELRCTIYTNHKSLRCLMDQPNLNMSQRIWLDVVKDYEYKILYHRGNTKVLVDTLSHKETSTPIRDLYLRMIIFSPMLDLIKKAQVERLEKENYKEERIRDQITLFFRDSHGLLTQCDKLWVPVASGLRKILLDKAHKMKFSIHPEATKMYRNMRLSY